MDAECPDLVVTDLHMPGMDGVVVARHAQEHTPSIPVMLMTACHARETERRAGEAGAMVYLPKPFAAVDFVSAIRRALAGSRETAASRHRPPV